MKKIHVIGRRAFARRYKNWTIDDWNLVIFTDEADLFPTKSGKRYCRTRGKGNAPNPTQHCQDSQPKIAVKVWGQSLPLESVL